MFKRSLLFIMIFSMLIVAAACTTIHQSQGEMSEDEIKQVLKDVVGSEQSLQDAGLRYFSELSNENKNILESQKLLEAIDTNPGSVFILDIRNEKDYNAGHINGAKNVWWFDVGKNIDILPKDKPIVVCCYTGQSAGQVVGVLRLMGYNAASLLGGMNNGWNAEKMPLISDGSSAAVTITNTGAKPVSKTETKADVKTDTKTNTNTETNTNTDKNTETDAYSDKGVEDVSNDVS